MKKNQKFIALGLAAVVAFSSVACGTQETGNEQSSTETETQNTAADTQTKETEAPAQTETETAAETKSTGTGDDGSYEECTITFSWWGGDSRHEATLAAIEAFEAKYPGITVEPTYGAWSGWEDSMATMFATQTAPDVNQVNWNWLDSYSSDGNVIKLVQQHKAYCGKMAKAGCLAFP